MATRRFSLENGGPKRLVIKWQTLMDEVIVRLDGEVVGFIDELKELRSAKQLVLPDQSILTIQFVRGSSPFFVQRDGVPLPGSFNPRIAFRVACLVQLLVGLFSASMGVFELTTANPDGWISIPYGLFFLIFAYFSRQGSLTAMRGAWAVFLVELLASLVFYIALMCQGGNGLAWLVIPYSMFRLFLVGIPLVAGIDALKILRWTDPALANA